MHDPASDLAAELLTRAEHALRVAVYLLTMPDPPAESIGFHAQHCAEKALKGFLTLHRIPFERCHDLNYLIDLCITHDRAFEQLRTDAGALTPCAVEYRDPDALRQCRLSRSVPRLTQRSGTMRSLWLEWTNKSRSRTVANRSGGKLAAVAPRSQRV